MLQENWPLPVVVVAHHVTFDGHPDSYPLHVASKILSDGQSSRIYRKLVYETGLALSAFGGGNIIEHPNLFFAVAIVQAGQSVDEAEKALIAELDRLRNEPVTDRELQRAKNQLARDYVIGRESNRQKAQQLAHAAVIHGDAATADGEFDIFMNTAAADVQRVARTYFTPENRLVLRVMPGRAPGAGTAMTGQPPACSSAPCSRCCSLPAVVAAGQAARWPSSSPPRPLSARDVKFPPYELQTLPNGLQVVVVMHTEQPAVSMRAIVRAGGAQDPEGKPGVAAMVVHAARPGHGHAERRAGGRQD